jgi:hypothetical protein
MKNLIYVLLLLPSTVFAQNPQLINWFVGADLVGITNSESDLPSDFAVREFEISAFSQIDYMWQGNLTVAFHKEPGAGEETHSEVHEAFIFTNQLFSDTSFKLGRFFLGFGRLNRFHRHDWSISEAPMYHKEFFGPEAVKDDGAEFSKLLADDFYLKLTVGLATGNQFKDEHNHAEEEEENHRALMPTHYFRLSSFHEFSTQKGIEYSGNYIGRTDGEGVEYQYFGLDLIFKNKFARYYEDLVQFEAWHRKTKDDHETQNDYGAYVYYEKGFDQNHSLGFKLEWFAPNEHEHEEAEEEGHELEFNKEYFELNMAYIYYSSEFMRVRLNVAHAKGLIIDEKKVDNTKILLQTVFTIGAHPAHLY